MKQFGHVKFFTPPPRQLLERLREFYKVYVAPLTPPSPPIESLSTSVVIFVVLTPRNTYIVIQYIIQIVKYLYMLC